MTTRMWGWRRRILCLLGFHNDYLELVHVYDYSDRHKLVGKVIKVCGYCFRVKWSGARTQREYWTIEVEREED